MKKLLFIIGIFISVAVKAQGLRLTGQNFTDPSTGFQIDTIYSYPLYYYSSSDSIVNLSLPPSVSAQYAKAKNYIIGSSNYNIPQLYFSFKSATGYPTATTLYNYIKPILQAPPYNFTVTTF